MGNCGPKIDLSGKRFNRWLVIELSDKRNKHGAYFWKCICDCGNTGIIDGSSLTRCNSQSCGCLQKEYASKRTKLSNGIYSFNTLYLNYKSKAKQRDLSFDLNKEDFEKLTSQKCYYCGIEPKQIRLAKGANGSYIYNGIDKVNNNIGYTLDNCVPCCINCNRAKMDMTQQEFYNLIERIYGTYKSRTR